MSLTHVPTQCPQCRSLLRVRRDLFGQQVCCGYCNLVFEAGGRGATPPVVPAEADEPITTPAESSATPAAALPVEERVAAGNHAAAPQPFRDEIETLRGERDRARDEADAMARRLVALRELVGSLGDELARAREAARAAGAERRLPVLAKDLERWRAAAAFRPRVVAVPVGPPPLPPSLDEIALVDQYIEALKGLLKTPLVNGKPFHVLFDAGRFQALQAKFREAALLADRLVSNVERSRTQKELLWHLMVAQRTDELNRKKR